MTTNPIETVILEIVLEKITMLFSFLHERNYAVVLNAKFKILWLQMSSYFVLYRVVIYLHVVIEVFLQRQEWFWRDINFTIMLTVLCTFCFRMVESTSTAESCKPFLYVTSIWNEVTFTSTEKLTLPRVYLEITISLR